MSNGNVPAIAGQTSDLTYLTLTDCETIIAENIGDARRAYHEIGKALRIIRDQNLWKDKYLTFKDYCRVRWNVDVSYATRLIASEDVYKHLLPIGNAPANEAQARPLTALEPDMQPIAWDLVEKTAPGGKITATHVQSVVNILQEAVATGALDPGDGAQLPLSQAIRAAVTEETYERMKRQEAHISESNSRKTGGGSGNKTEPILSRAPGRIVSQLGLSFQFILEISNTDDYDRLRKALQAGKAANLLITVVSGEGK